jgi:hypothetical protein
VIALSQTLPQSLDRARIKEIRSLIQEEAPTDVSSRLFQLSRQVAEQYAALGTMSQAHATSGTQKARRISR